MKLTDLDPKWERSGGPGIFNTAEDGTLVPAPERLGIGVSFSCPCGLKSIDVGGFDFHRCTVLFENPLDGGGKFDATTPGHWWHREGDTFENLTLTPSIHRINSCGWHGFITNGEIITL